MLSVRWSRGVPAVFLRARRRAAAGRARLHAVHGPPCLCTVYKCREEEARLNQYGAPSTSLSFTAFLLRPPPGARAGAPTRPTPTAPPTRRARPPTVSARPSADRRAVPRGPSPQCRPTSQASVKHQLARLNATSKDSKGQGRLMLKSLKRRSNPREDLHLIPHLPRRHSAAEAAFERPVTALALALAVSVRSYKLDAEPRGVGIQPRVAPRVDVGE